MSQNGTFDFTDFAGFDDSSVTEDFFHVFNGGKKIDPGLWNHQGVDPSPNGGSWYLQPPEVGGTSQPNAGVEVLEGIHGPSCLCNSSAAPTTLGPGNQMSLNEGYNSHIHPGMATYPSSQQQAAIPHFTAPALSSAPALSYGFRSPSTSYCTSLTGTPDPESLFQVDGGYGSQIEVPDPDPFSQFTMSCSPDPPSPKVPLLVPVASTSGPHTMSSSPDPPSPKVPLLVPVASTSGPHTMSYSPDPPSPEVPLPVPVASASGPQRSKRRGGVRRHNPLRSTKKKTNVDEGEQEDEQEDVQEDGWDVALSQFRAKLRDLVFDGEPLGEVLPEKVLAARITKLVKEELKRSPFQDTKAGEGKRPRNVEDYLIVVLRDRSELETLIKVEFLESVADVLEARLVAVNDGPGLRQPWVTAQQQVGKGARLEQTEGRAKKNKRERVKRDQERVQLERMSYLFKIANSQKSWTRVDILCFAVVYSLFGPSAFSPGFVVTTVNG